MQVCLILFRLLTCLTKTFFQMFCLTQKNEPIFFFNSNTIFKPPSVRCEMQTSSQGDHHVQFGFSIVTIWFFNIKSQKGLFSKIMLMD